MAQDTWRKAAHRCRVRFCKADSLLKPGRTTKSAGCWEGYCGRHLPKNVEAQNTRMAPMSALATAKGVEVMRERRKALAEYEKSVVFASEAAILGEYQPSTARERSGWGLVAESPCLHYFRRGESYTLCGQFHIMNQPVTPNYHRRCRTCLAAVVFAKEGLR